MRRVPALFEVKNVCESRYSAMTAATLPGLTRPAPIAVRAPLIAFSYSAMKTRRPGQALESARADIRGGGSSSMGGQSFYRPRVHARTSAFSFSLFGFLRAKFIERPRIVRVRRLGLVEMDGVAVRRGDAGHGLAGLLSALDERGDTRIARLLLAAGSWRHRLRGGRSDLVADRVQGREQPIAAKAELLGPSNDPGSGTTRIGDRHAETDIAAFERSEDQRAGFLYRARHGELSRGHERVGRFIERDA